MFSRVWKTASGNGAPALVILRLWHTLVDIVLRVLAIVQLGGAPVISRQAQARQDKFTKQLMVPFQPALEAGE